MRGIKYFTLNINNTLVDQDESNLKTLNDDYYINVFSSLIENIALNFNIIDVVIPYHNSPHLAKTLDSIKNSFLPVPLKINLTIVCSACEVKYIQEAYRCKEYYADDTLLINIIEQDLPGKPLALNTFLRQTNAEIIVQVVDDITLHRHALFLSYMSLVLNSDYNASALVGLPSDILINNKGNMKLLDEVKLIYYEKFLINQEYSLMGRMYCFRRSCIPEGFPEHIMSEDYWLELQSRITSKGIIIVNNTFIYYTNPLSWLDFFRQIDRFDHSFRQLKRECSFDFHKHFGDVKNSLGFMLNDKLHRGTAFNSLFKFFAKDPYSLKSKFLYLLVLFYQFYISPLKYFINPLKKATFKRELSTLGGKSL